MIRKYADSLINNEVKQILENVKPKRRHSYYQLKHFVIGKEVSIQAKLRKCLLELDSRSNALEQMFMSLEDEQDNLMILELEIEEYSNQVVEKETIEEKKKQIKRRKLMRRASQCKNLIEEIGQKITECEEEMRFLLHAFKEISKIEELQPFDDLDTERAIWDEKYAEELQLRVLTNRPLDVDFVRSCLCMDTSSSVKQEMHKLLGQIEKQLKSEKFEQEVLDRQVKTNEKNANEEEDCQKESLH